MPFIDGDDLPAQTYPKDDLAPIPGGEDPAKWVRAVDWNVVCEALIALRDRALELEDEITAGVPDGDKGDIVVTGSGSTWTIENSAITLAKIANIATARFLGRITASSGVVEELTATQATSMLDTFTSGNKGLAPPSGGGTDNFLRADGTWAEPAAGVSAGGAAHAVVGVGWDGALVYDGSTTILGMAPAANVYTLTRDIFASSIQVDSGVRVICGGYRIYCTGAVVNNGAISANGSNASGTTGGTATPAGVFAASGAGVNGANGANGQTGGTSTALPRFAGAATSSSNLAGAAGAGGAAGNVLFRGGGGGGASASQTGGSGGNVTLMNVTGGGPNPRLVESGVQGASTTRWSCGGGGGSGGGTGGSIGGGSGAGGGVCYVVAESISGTGSFEAKGGNGGNGGANAGGGAGGGGGLVYIMYGTRSGSLTISVAGGTPGDNGAGLRAGGAGADGYAVLVNLSGDGT